MTQRIKLLLIENSIGLSGSVISLCNLVAGLNEAEFSSFVIFSREEQFRYFRSQFDSDAEATVIRRRDEIKTTPIAKYLGGAAQRVHPLVARMVYALYSAVDLFVVFVPYIFRMAKFARRNRVDLIHQNNGFDISAVLLALLMRKPLVGYQRGPEWDSVLVRYLARFVNLYIANSEQTRRDLRNIGVPADKITVITPPVSLEKYFHGLDCAKQRQEFGVSDSDACFGILGTLIPWKGHRDFLKAAQRVILANPNAKAFIIGGVPDGCDPNYERELRDLAKGLGIENRVVFTGFREDVPEMIQMQKVIVHASISPEPFGRVIIEAMAMRKPVVASKAGGPLEIIDDGINGYLVPSGNDADLGDRILTLLGDPVLAARLGQEAYLKAMRCYAVEPHVNAVSSAYRNVLRDAGRSPGGGHEGPSSKVHDAGAPWS